LTKWCNQTRDNSAAIAAHYGSVSAVTFVATTSYITSMGMVAPAWGAAMLALLEAPAIVVSLLLLKTTNNASWHHTLQETLGGKSVLLLVGGMLMGWASNTTALTAVTPFFITLFPGVLCLFLLTLGSMAADRLTDLKTAGWRLAAFAICMPLLHGFLGLAIAVLLNFSPAHGLCACCWQVAAI
jgi:hypothetical protein